MNQTPLLAAAPRNQKNFNQTAPRIASKSELIDGRVVQKPPAGRWHNIIRANFVIAIGSRIQRAHTETYAGDMQVQVGKSSVLFPDVAIVSGEPHFTDNQFSTLTNPTAVIEIFSPVSASQDRTQRMEGFLAIPSIKECLLVNEDEMRVEHYARQQVKQWVYRIYNERDDVIVLDALNVRVSLTEVYSQVRLGESALSSTAVN
jgi:Uma2 family endonuclease